MGALVRDHCGALADASGSDLWRLPRSAWWLFV